MTIQQNVVKRHIFRDDVYEIFKVSGRADNAVYHQYGNITAGISQKFIVICHIKSLPS